MAHTSKKAAGLLYGPEKHHLDHLAPLCSLLNLPLIVTEEEIFELAQKYYPQLSLHHYEYLELPERVVKEYEVLFTCLPRDLIDEVLFFAQKLFRKKIHTIWCPHGNSDKGHSSFLMEGLHKEKIALVYGKKMIDFLIRKHVYEQLQSCIFIDNFRHQYYLKNKNFYDVLVQKEIVNRFGHKNKTILYAPTWQDREQSSSFFDSIPFLLDTLPENFNLIVKPHPNLLFQNPEKILRLNHQFEDRPNILFLSDFPPIYPLLAHVDIYLGDMSSIGYDFLTFNRPMFFLNPNARNPLIDPGLYLFRCGIEIPKEKYAAIYDIIEENLSQDQQKFKKIREETYHYTFGEERNWSNIHKELMEAISSLEEEDLNFW